MYRPEWKLSCSALLSPLRRPKYLICTSIILARCAIVENGTMANEHFQCLFFPSFLPFFLPFFLFFPLKKSKYRKCFLIFDNFPGYPSYSNLWKLSKHASFKVFKVISVAFARKNIQYKGTIFTFFYIAIYQSNVYIVSSCTYVMTSSCIPPSPDPSSRPVFR